jgi:hypothetical protein
LQRERVWFRAIWLIFLEFFTSIAEQGNVERGARWEISAKTRRATLRFGLTSG